MDDIERYAQFLRTQPQLLVCGNLGVEPLQTDARRDALVGAHLYKTLETVARVQGQWDVAYTTTQDTQPVEIDFLARDQTQLCRRARKRITDHGDFLISPRATAQLQREIIESASTDPAASAIDRKTLVHLWASITSEQNLRPGFTGDVPTRAEEAALERRMSTFGLEEMREFTSTFITEEVASSLFNQPLKYEMALSNTHDLGLGPWPSRSSTADLGATPADSFKLATGVDLLDIMRLGARIVQKSTTEHQVRFSRGELIAAGAPADALDYAFREMALDLDSYRTALQRDRQAGAIAHQRYTLMRFPFLAIDGDTFIMLRHQWAIDRLCGGQLYFEAWANFRSQSSSRANRFKSAMNDAFENLVGMTLHRIVDKSPHLRLIVDEPEMQAAWTEKKGQTPSVCDWILFGEGHCVVIDATNHAVKEFAAQGLASFDEYSADLQTVFTEGKFEQLLSTITEVQDRGGWGIETVDSETNFVPLVVVPDAGVPTGVLTAFDMNIRGYAQFAHLQPHVYAPGVVPLSDVQLLEGMADLAHKLPQFPGQDRDMMKLIAGWRHAATRLGEPLQMVLIRRGFPLPLSEYILTTSAKMKELISPEAPSEPTSISNRKILLGNSIASVESRPDLKGYERFDDSAAITIEWGKIEIACKIIENKENPLLGTAAMTFVPYEESIHPFSPDFSLPLVDQISDCAEHLERSWEKLCYAFALVDPTLFPSLQELTPADREILERYIAASERLASCSAFCTDSRIQINGMSGEEVDIDLQFPALEEFTALRLAFRCIHNDDESASFARARSTLMRVIKRLPTKEQGPLRAIVAQWHKARGALRSRLLHNLVCEMAAPPVQSDQSVKLSYSNIYPDSLIESFDLEIAARFSAPPVNLSALPDDARDALYEQHALLLAITGLSHVYFGMAALARAALGTA